MGSTKLGGRGDVHPIKGVQSCIFYVCVCVVWLDKLRSRGANSTCVGIDISFRLIRALHSQKKGFTAPLTLFQDINEENE